MPEPLKAQPTPTLALLERLRASPGLAALVAEAEATWRARVAAQPAASDSTVDSDGPAWRAFEDAFPTFYEFTNRPR